MTAGTGRVLQPVGHVLDAARRHPWVARAAAVVAFFVAIDTLWTVQPGIVLRGAVIGGLTALIAFGIALVWRANRIVNFAQGDLGAAPAALVVLLIVGPGWPYPLAVLAGLAAAVVLGITVEVLVIRRFANAPRLLLTVATLGLAQVLVGIGLVLPWLFDFATPPHSFPLPLDVTFRVEPITFDGHDVLAMITVPLAIVGLTWLLRRTDIGIAIRASAEGAGRASLLGVNVGQVRIVVWVVASVLATVAMVLRAGVVGLPLGTVLGPAILLRALAAAVIGRMENLPTIFVAATALGIIEAAVLFDRGDTALIPPILFLVVLVALAVQHRDKLARFTEASSWRASGEVRPVPHELADLPEVRWGRRVLMLGLLGAAVALPLVLDEADTHKAAAVAIFGIVAISLVVLTGWAGQVSLGQVAFMGVGAAVGGWVTASLGWDLSLALLAAGVAGGALSFVVGLPALRVRGLLLAVVTLAFALAVSTYALNREFVHWLPSGRVPRTPLFGRVMLDSEARYYYLCLAVLIIVLGMVGALRRGRTGRVLMATRQNERAVQAAGVNATRAKLTAFTAAGFLAAVAGALFVHHQQSFSASSYAPEESLRAFTMVVIGGLGSVPGALLGTVYVQATNWFQPLLPAGLRPLLAFLATGLGMLVVLMVLPGGLGSVLYGVRDRLLRLVADRRGIMVPSLVADGATGAGGPAPELSGEHGEGAEGAEILGGPPAASNGSTSNGSTRNGSDGDGTPGTGPALLEITGLEARYGSVQVLFGVDLHVGPGEIVALLGTNGAGKSTVLNSVSGLLGPSSGSILLDGEDVAGRPAHQICRLGVAQSPGGRGVFPSLTVRENLRMAAWPLRRDRAAADRAVGDALDLLDELRSRLDDPAGNLSGGQQQMLTLAMAFVSSPRLLMIDELSLGLAPTIVERLLDVVERIRERGTAIVLVEQSVNVALTVASRAYFLEKGEVRFAGPTKDLLDRPDVLRSVFLEGAASRGAADRPDAAARRSPVPRDPASDEPVLELHGVSRSFGGVRAVDDVDLSVAPGEIVGLIGPNGAGKTTLFDLVSGFVPVDAGRIVLHGRDITALTPDGRARAGLGRSFQDAALFSGLTVAETIAVALDAEVEVRDPLAIALNVSAATRSEAAVRARVDELIELMGLRAFRDKFVAELSTGSRRIVDLACMIGQQPSVILFDEPSSGIAQREAESLGPVLQGIRDQTGAALLVIEHDMPLVCGIADRLVALDLGRVLTVGPPDEVVRHPMVVESYLGGRPEVVARSGAVAPGPSPDPERGRPEEVSR